MREKLKNMKWIIISALILVVLIAVGVSVKASGNTGIAKSKTFTENMDGYYVYFRAVDEAGNAGDWSNAQRIWIDTTTPTVTAKENSVTIKEGDVNTLADYFTVVANGSNDDVDVVCTIGGTTYTTTETLTVEGSPYTVVCTATKNGGKSGSASMEIIVEEAGPPPWDGTVATSFARGTGTEVDPYIIETPQQLAYLASTTNTGTTDYSGVYFKQGADLDLGGVQAEDGTWSGQLWTPIGDYSSFSGNFDGDNHKIYNLYCNSNEAGLFDNLEDAKISRVHVISGYVEGTEYVGGVTAKVYESAIRDCSNGATIIVKNTGESQTGAGGIAGYARSMGIYDGTYVCNCSNSGSVTNLNYGTSFNGAAGIVGLNDILCADEIEEISGCTNTGVISGETVDEIINKYGDGCVGGGD